MDAGSRTDGLTSSQSMSDEELEVVNSRRVSAHPHELAVVRPALEVVHVALGGEAAQEVLAELSQRCGVALEQKETVLVQGRVAGGEGARAGALHQLAADALNDGAGVDPACAGALSAQRPLAGTAAEVGPQRVLPAGLAGQGVQTALNEVRDLGQHVLGTCATQCTENGSPQTATE